MRAGVGIEPQADQKGGDGRPEHGTDVIHHLDLGDGRGQYRCVGDGAELVAEVRAGDDSARCCGQGDAQTLCDADECDPECSRRSPGCSGETGGETADEKGRGQENLGAQDLETGKNEVGDGPGGHPDGDQRPDGQQDHDGARGSGNHGNDALIEELVPGIAITEAEYHGREHPAEHQQERDVEAKGKAPRDDDEQNGAEDPQGSPESDFLGFHW